MEGCVDMAFTVRWLGQGGFLFNLGGHILAIDPYLSDSVQDSSDHFRRMAPPPVQPDMLGAEVIICTHDHLDHLDPDTLCRTAAEVYAGPPSCLEHYEALGLRKEKLTRIGRGDIYHLGKARIMGVPANHTEDSIGVVIEFGGVKTYVTGDTLQDGALADIGCMGIDILLTCINGKLGNMNAIEAAALAKALPCKLAIPMHYGMFAENTVDPNDFSAAMSESGIPVVELCMGKTVDVYDLMKLTV